MKKIILILACFLLLAGNLYAGNSSTAITGDDIYQLSNIEGKKFRVITIALTADDGTGAFDSLTLNTTNGARSTLQGWRLKEIRIDFNHAGTEPKEDSDMTFTDTVDLLDGNGTDQVDNSAERAIYAAVDGQASTREIVGNPVLAVSGNDVVSATGTIYIILVP